MSGSKQNKNKKIRHRKMARRRFISIIVMSIVLILLIYLISGKIKKQFLRSHYDLSSLKVPEYVSVQLINNNKARTRIPITKVNDIVIHYTGNPGTSAQNNRDFFNQKSTDVCSHFVIGLNGEIIQCIPLNEKSSASNHRNFDTVSIEVCHPDETGKFTDEAYASLIKLTAWLCKSVDLNEKHVIRHYDVTGKYCPLYYVKHENKWKQLKADVAEAKKEHIKQSSED